MLCESCGERDATVHLTRIEGGEVKLFHLCERCAAESEVETSEAPKHPLAGILHAVQEQAAATSGEAGRCQFCHSTMLDFRATGRWGCARCYQTFEQAMRELLRRVHGSSKHVGRGYQAPRHEITERAGELGSLRERLRRAIETEQFELAADLRDKIRVLE